MRTGWYVRERSILIHLLHCLLPCKCLWLLLAASWACRARMQALDCEEALLRHDQQLLRQFIEQDCVYMNGVQHDAR